MYSFPSLLILLMQLSFLLLLVFRRAEGAANAKCREPVCDVTRIHGMKSADCYRKDFKTFPKCLTGDAEVIDLTYNRIRELKADDLKKYGNLKFLYLGENMITKIDAQTFADMDYLQALDLSYNAFAASTSLPDVIFHLPSLKNLYLSQNQNINIVDAIENAAPIGSPLVYLDISFNQYADAAEEAEPQPLPLMGIVPTLIKYNVSGMELLLRAEQFAGLCNLEILVNDNVTASFAEGDECECWTLQRWLKERKVKFTPFQCTLHPNECAHAKVREADMELFESCKHRHAEEVYQSKVNKALMIAAITLGIVLVITLYVVWKWRRTRQRRKKIQRSIIKQTF